MHFNFRHWLKLAAHDYESDPPSLPRVYPDNQDPENLKKIETTIPVPQLRNLPEWSADQFNGDDPDSKLNDAQARFYDAVEESPDPLGHLMSGAMDDPRELGSSQFKQQVYRLFKQWRDAMDGASREAMVSYLQQLMGGEFPKKLTMNQNVGPKGFSLNNREHVEYITQHLIKSALEKMGIPFYPKAIGLFRPRLTGNRMEDFFKIEDDDAKEQYVRSFRAQQVEIIRERIKNIYEKMVHDFGITPKEFTHFLKGDKSRINTIGENGEGELLAKFTKQGLSPQDVEAMYDKLQNAVHADISQTNTQEHAGIMYTGRPVPNPDDPAFQEEYKRKTGKALPKPAYEKLKNQWEIFGQADRSFYKDPSPIKVDEVLEPLGFTYRNYPRRMTDELDYRGYRNRDNFIPVEGDSPETIKQKQRAFQKFNAQARQNPTNLRVLWKAIQDAGYEQGGLGKLRSLMSSRVPLNEITRAQGGGEESENDEAGSDFEEDNAKPTSYSDQLLYFIFHHMCGNSPQEFVEMLRKLSEIGVPEEISKKLADHFEQGVAKIPDPIYNSYGAEMGYRSQAEMKCASILRNTYNLNVIPIDVGLIAPPESPNNTGYQVDFLVRAPILEGWMVGPDNTYHPKVKDNVLFVAEYFGLLSSKSPIDRPITRPLLDTNEEIAEVLSDPNDPDSEKIQAVPGTNITRGQKYTISADWKRMTQNYVTHAAGYGALHIDEDLKPMEIMGELDKNQILYRSLACKPTTCLVYKTLQAHFDEGCNWDQCPANQYVTVNSAGKKEVKPPHYNDQEALVAGLIAAVEVQDAYTPLLQHAYDTQRFSTKQMRAYYMILKEFSEKLRETTLAYWEARDHEKHGSQPAKSSAALMHEYYDLYTQKDRDLKQLSAGAVQQEYSDLISKSADDPRNTFVNGNAERMAYAAQLQKRLQTLRSLLERVKEQPLPKEEFKSIVDGMWRPMKYNEEKKHVLMNLEGSGRTALRWYPGRYKNAGVRKSL